MKSTRVCRWDPNTQSFVSAVSLHVGDVCSVLEYNDEGERVISYAEIVKFCSDDGHPKGNNFVWVAWLYGNYLSCHLDCIDVCSLYDVMEDTSHLVRRSRSSNTSYCPSPPGFYTFEELLERTDVKPQDLQPYLNKYQKKVSDGCDAIECSFDHKTKRLKTEVKIRRGTVWELVVHTENSKDRKDAIVPAEVIQCTSSPNKVWVAWVVDGMLTDNLQCVRVTSFVGLSDLAPKVRFVARKGETVKCHPGRLQLCDLRKLRSLRHSKVPHPVIDKGLRVVQKYRRVKVSK